MTVAATVAAIFVGTPLGTDSGASADAGQTGAGEIEPDPRFARRDRGRPPGCPPRTQPDSKLRCIYGDRAADTTVVALGDSKAMQYFPALDEIAKRRGWKLVGLTRAGCPPMTVRYAYRCDRWRRRALRRLERIDPALVVTSSGVAYRVIKGGRRLSHRASGPILRDAYVKTLRELSRRGAHVSVLVNPPRAPRDPPTCVLRNLASLDRCAFARGSAPYRSYVVRAARRARVQRIDVNQVACRGGTCPAVIDGVLAQRDRVHLTATFVRTLSSWLEARLPALD